MARTAFVSTYVPHRCGIATFTSDLAAASGPHQVVALHPTGGPSAYPPAVRNRINRDTYGDYLVAAEALNASDIDTVSIQHEYGIWGGPDGEYVLDFVRALRIPVVTTLHTVLRTPTPSQGRVLTELAAMSTVTVVMSSTAAGLLAGSYGVRPGRVRIVPHGVPDLPLVDPETVKPRLGLDGRLVILSFGLLGPGKGYDSVIQAMTVVAAAVPSALYVVLGATHPALLHHEGEAYRRKLEAMVRILRVSGHVRFVDRYVGRQELGTWLEAADIFVTPYPNLDQIVSGTLSYAMSAGRAVVSTPYAHARELLASGRGRLVPPGSPAALAGTLVELLEDRHARDVLGRRAYEHTRDMTWSEVGAAYAEIFAAVSHAPRTVPRAVATLVGARG